MTDTETRLRHRAHQLWEQAGRPDGRSDEFWTAAEREMADMAEQGTGGAARDDVPEASYDKVVADSFPASDPPANTGITGPEETVPASAVTTANEPTPDPGGTKPTKGKASKAAKPAKGEPRKPGKKEAGSKQSVRSGDRNDSPADPG